MGEEAEYEIFRTTGVDISDDGWLENHFRREHRFITSREQAAKRAAREVRKEHGERLNAQHTEAQEWGPSGHPAFEKPQARAMRKNEEKRKRKRTMKSKLELRNIAASVSDELVTVRCTYSGAGKRYTFLCPTDVAETLREDDNVVVSTKNNTFEVVQVVRVDEECDIDDLNLNYQWVLSKVDTTRLDTLHKWHEQVGNDLHKQQRKQARKVMLEQMNVDGVAPLALTAGLSGEVIDAKDTGE